MKKGYLVLAGVLASALISTSALANVAQGTDLDTDLSVSYLTKGDNGTVNNPSAIPGLTGLYAGGNTGILGPNAAIQFTYSLSSITPPTALEIDYGSSYQYTASANTVGTLVSSASIPKVLATAGFGTTGGDHGMLYLMNRTNAPIDFKVSFFGSSVVTLEQFKVSAVPLPATLSMFGAALLAMFGFSHLRKKNALISL